MAQRICLQLIIDTTASSCPSAFRRPSNLKRGSAFHFGCRLKGTARIVLRLMAVDRYACARDSECMYGYVNEHADRYSSMSPRAHSLGACRRPSIITRSPAALVSELYWLDLQASSAKYTPAPYNPCIEDTRSSNPVRPMTDAVRAAVP